ncbi:(-)-germacrene D synthase-like [Lotus japonicus]|uniref:(-)-germacrene D synthase-like n=1 Tax=Lotus japonicus TaxID=34305 RepID=UPI0025884348|nr:(-)-germacrene D synthase-like [Lotus japonicus]
MSHLPIDATQQAVPPHMIKRPCANFRPSVWGDFFLQYDSESLKVDENMKQQVQMQKEEVKKIFLSSNNSISKKLNLIDSFQRLGISHHLEDEIDEVLEQIHNTFTNNNMITIKEGSLHFLALAFRLLRQKGYRISSDIFEQFKNKEGNFNEEVAKDVQGMWSLYEAAQLRVGGEDIFDEALDFTYTHLNFMTDKLSPSLAAQITHYLRKPFHKGVPRLESRLYMSFYEQDPSHSKVLLTFAKLDFNMLQKLHQKEVASITRWWKNSDFAAKVPYVRDRVVEVYFWPFTMSYEAKYSTSRRIVAKLIACVTLLDDTYDAYGTIEELELFTQALQRWDISVIQSLPECIKVVFTATVELWDDIETTTAVDGKLGWVLPYIKQAFYNLAQSYFVESKWCHENYVPTYNEYKGNGVGSSTLRLLIISFIGLGEFSTKELIDWIFTNPTIIEAISIIGRLVDDMASHKFEQQRVHVASAVECCMKQYDISQEAAYKLMQKDVKDLWMVVNEECLKLDYIPKPVLDCILNLSRANEFMYDNFEDRFTDGKLLKEYMVALLVDPIQ